MRKIKVSLVYLILTVLIGSIGFPIVSYGSESSPELSSEQLLSLETTEPDGQLSQTEELAQKDDDKQEQQCEQEQEPEQPNPSFKINIVAKQDLYRAGDTAKYSIKIINDGNVDLEDVVIKDTLIGMEKKIETLTVEAEHKFEIAYSIPSIYRGKSISNRVLASGRYLGRRVDGKDEVITKVCPNWFIEEDESTINSKGPIATDSTEANSVKTKSVQLDSVQYPDTIQVDKEAHAIPGCRTYEVNLNITGTPPPKPIDVILVLDRSGSMNSGSPSAMYYAKQAARSFVQKVLENPNNRVAVVSYAYEGKWAWWPPGFVGDLGKDTTINCGFENNINDVENAIDNIVPDGGTNTEAGFVRARNLMTADGRSDANKVIVMLTDGVPTSSIGNYYGPNEPAQHNDHTEAAYKAGQSCFDIARVFTVGLLNEVPQVSLAVARDTLRRAQNAGYYETFSAADLSDIYDDISEQLGHSAKDAVVTDVISEHFDLVQDSFQTDPQSAVEYDESTRTITWAPGTIINEANLTYSIKAKRTFPGGEDVPTNDWARLNYTDVNDNQGQTKDFPIPKVDVQSPLNVDAGPDREIIWGDTIGIGDNLQVTWGYPPYNYKWTCDTDPEWESTGQNPSVNPDKDTTYTITVTDQYGCTKQDTVLVKVKKGSLTITKTVQNENTDRKFSIWIYGPQDRKWAVLLQNGETATINNLKPGSYTIKEVVPMNFQKLGEDQDIVVITRENLDVSMTITNKKVNDKWFYDEDEVINRFNVRLLN
ncbi:MAG: VWA domain-containing protein [Clostridia bacterium]|nr:VWA domain-containing protein [Clostridia bacterium]